MTTQKCRYGLCRLGTVNCTCASTAQYRVIDQLGRAAGTMTRREAVRRGYTVTRYVRPGRLRPSDLPLRPLRISQAVRDAVTAAYTHPRTDKA